MDVLQQLSKLRGAAHLSLTVVSDRTGISIPRLSKIFNGKNPPDVRASSLQILADAIDAEVVVVPRNKLAAIQALLGSDQGLLAITETPSALDLSL